MDTGFFFTGLLEPFHFDSSLLSTWNSQPSAAEFSHPSEQSPDCFLTSISDKSMDPYANFESSLTSTVSSPNAPGSADAFAIQDHVGKLSIACNSDDLSPDQSRLFTAATDQYLGDNASNSCYMSLFNSSTNLQLPIMNHLVNLRNTLPLVNSLPPHSIPEHRLEERATKFSSVGSLCFNAQNNQLATQNHIELPHTSGISNVKLTSSNEEPSVSEQISLGEGEFRIPTDMKSRKRQSRPKGKKPMVDGAHSTANAYKMEEENGEPNVKRSRLIKAENDANEETQKPCEPPKDYIHVRARRGQATDSHSLAERVRREKISERMKLLEDLVPGCNKVTGKALMLDEIINYVQSLQRQVEFLSMKLATVNHSTRLDFNIDNSVFKRDPSGDYPLAALHPLDCTEIDGQMNYEFWLRSFEVKWYSFENIGMKPGGAPSTLRTRNSHSPQIQSQRNDDEEYTSHSDSLSLCFQRSRGIWIQNGSCRGLSQAFHLNKKCNSSSNLVDYLDQEQMHLVLS